jgi:hypothetical protein
MKFAIASILAFAAASSTVVEAGTPITFKEIDHKEQHENVRRLQELESSQAARNGKVHGGRGSARALGSKRGKKGCSRDYRFREESNLFIAPTFCEGECLQDDGSDNPPFIEVCDPNEDDQKWTIEPYGDGKSIASTIKGDSGSCIASPEDCDLLDVEMAPCDDPRTQMVWIDTSFQSWYCWETSQAQILIDIDACDGGVPYWDDDAFYYNNVFFLDQCQVENLSNSVIVLP